MKKKLIFSSTLLIIFILIIFLFILTANAVGNTENGIKNTRIVIDDAKNEIENTNNSSESSINDEIKNSVDGSDASVIDTDTSVGIVDNLSDESNIKVMNDIPDDTNSTNGSKIDDNTIGEDNNTSKDNDNNDGRGNTTNDTSIIDNTGNIENSSNVDNVNDNTDNNKVDNNNNVDDSTNVDDTNNVNDGNNIDDSGNSSDINNTNDTNFPELTVEEPSMNSVCTNNVLFNFSANDKLDDNLTYTIDINGIERSTGAITEGEPKEVKINLEDGFYTWEIKIEDSLGNTASSGPTGLYVDTEEPDVTLNSPEDSLINTGAPLNFSFYADDALTAQYKDLSLTYEIDIDGEPLDGLGSGTMRSGECIQTQDIANLSEGAHEWSVYVEDEAGNNVTSDSRTFYIDKKGLRVSLISPNNENATASPKFKFRVSGGAGLPFNYTLLINGEEVKRSTCDGSENGTLEVGDDTENDYSIKASVPDSEDMTWTVRITDIAGNSYEPDPYHFSLDTSKPGRVANLSVTDVYSETLRSYTHDSPALYVNWDANTDDDLATTPYDVFISDSEPQSIEEMEKVKSTSDTNVQIERYRGKPLVYGKDYWVAAIARDKAGNYNKCFIAICGPVQTYEDMNITLDQGWNMKSVPKRLLESNSSPGSVFGNNSTVLYWNGECWEVPKTIEPCKGYWVYSPTAFENNVRFKPMSPESIFNDKSYSLDLAPGWQMIGPTSTQPIAWSTALASLKNSSTDYEFSNLITYSRNEGWNGLIPVPGQMNINGNVFPGGNLTVGTNSQSDGMLQNNSMMIPGQGYWIYMNKAGTYIPPKSDETVNDVPIDNSMTDNGNIGEVSDDNDTIDEANAVEGTAEDVEFGNGSNDNGATDVGTDDSVPIDNSMSGNNDIGEGSNDNGTIDEANAVEGTSEDAAFGNGSNDNGATDVGTDDGLADNTSSDDGASNDRASNDGTDNAGNADEIPISD